MRINKLHKTKEILKIKGMMSQTVVTLKEEEIEAREYKASFVHSPVMGKIKAD